MSGDARKGLSPPPPAALERAERDHAAAVGALRRAAERPVDPQDRAVFLAVAGERFHQPRRVRAVWFALPVAAATAALLIVIVRPGPGGGGADAGAGEGVAPAGAGAGAAEGAGVPRSPLTLAAADASTRVTVEGAAGAGGDAAARVGAALPAAARVRTGPDGAATLRDERTATVRVAGATSVRVARWTPDEAVLELEDGELRSAVRPRRRDQRFEVRTPYAVIRVVGTDFTVAHDAGEATEVRTHEGRVAVETLDGRSLGVVAAGERLRVEGPRTVLAEAEGEGQPGADVALDEARARLLAALDEGMEYDAPPGPPPEQATGVRSDGGGHEPADRPVRAGGPRSDDGGAALGGGMGGARSGVGGRADLGAAGARSDGGGHGPADRISADRPVRTGGPRSDDGGAALGGRMSGARSGDGLRGSAPSFELGSGGAPAPGLTVGGAAEPTRPELPASAPTTVGLPASAPGPAPDPAAPAAPAARTAEEVIRTARELLADGDDDAAIAALEGAAEQSWRVRATLGDAYRVAGRPLPARRAYEAALAAAGDGATEALVADLASLLGALEPDAAAGPWERYLERWPAGPSAPTALWALAERAAADGDRRRARDRYARLLSEHPTSPLASRAFVRLGRLLIEGEHWDDAEALFLAQRGAPQADQAEIALVGLLRVRLAQRRFEDARALVAEHAARFPAGRRAAEVAHLARAIPAPGAP
jgi:hypothetical protein